jgi:hypothetical protein
MLAPSPHGRVHGVSGKPKTPSPNTHPTVQKMKSCGFFDHNIPPLAYIANEL